MGIENFGHMQIVKCVTSHRYGLVMDTALVLWTGGNFTCNSTMSFV